MNGFHIKSVMSITLAHLQWCHKNEKKKIKKAHGRSVTGQSNFHKQEKTEPGEANVKAQKVGMKSKKAATRQSGAAP